MLTRSFSSWTLAGLATGLLALLPLPLGPEAAAKRMKRMHVYPRRHPRHRRRKRPATSGAGPSPEAGLAVWKPAGTVAGLAAAGIAGDGVLPNTAPDGVGSMVATS